MDDNVASVTESFVLYIMLFRLSTVAVGAIAIVLGYRLFLRNTNGETGESELTANVWGMKAMLRSAAPGLFFSLFGTTLIVVNFVNGGPGATIGNVDAVIETASKGDSNSSKDTGGGDELSNPAVSVRGSEAATFKALLNKARRLQREGKIDEAISIYEGVLPHISDMLNDVAWLSFERDDRLVRAISLSKAALLIVDNGDDSIKYLDTLARLLVKTDQFDEAIPILEELVVNSTDPDYASMLDVARGEEIDK